MTMMTTITPTSAHPTLPPAQARAERLAAFGAVAGEMLAAAAYAIDMSCSLPAGQVMGMLTQAKMRIIGVSMLMSELDASSRYALISISEGLHRAIDSPPLNADDVRHLADRLDAAVRSELYQIELSILYDRYV